MRCRGLHGLAGIANPSRFLFSGQSGVKRCQEFGRWRSHVFLRSLLVPATLSKRGIPPLDRFELLFVQPFAYVGFETEGGEEVREHHHVLEPWGLGEQEV